MHTVGAPCASAAHRNQRRWRAALRLVSRQPHLLSSTGVATAFTFLDSHHGTTAPSVLRQAAASMVIETRAARKAKEPVNKEPANKFLKAKHEDLLDVTAAPLVFPAAGTASSSVGAAGAPAKPYNYATTSITVTSPHIHVPGEDLAMDEDSAKVDISSVVAQSLKEQHGAFASAIIEKITGDIEGVVTNTMQTAVKVMDGKIETLGDTLAVVDGRVDRIEGKMDKLLEEMASIRFAQTASGGPYHSSNPNVHGSVNGNSSAQSPPPFPSGGLSADGAGIAFSSANSQGFFRATDPKILFCNTAQNTKVSSIEFHKSIVGLAGECSFGPDSFKFVGDEMDDRFDI